MSFVERSERVMVTIKETYWVMHSDKKIPSLMKKLLWLIVIWTVSVLALGSVSMIFRALMTAAGLKA